MQSPSTPGRREEKREREREKKKRERSDVNLLRKPAVLSDEIFEGRKIAFSAASRKLR
jgi:hypothetical protein